MVRTCLTGHVGCTVVFAAMLLGSCDSDNYEGPRYVITGGAGMNTPAIPPSSAGNASYLVTHEGVPVYDVTVTVNGLPTDLRIIGDHATTDFAADPGDPVVVVVRRGGFLAAARLSLPDGLNVISPLDIQDASMDITVEWDSPSFTSDLVQVTVYPEHTLGGEMWIATVDGSETSVTIPGGTLVSGSPGVEFYVTAINETTDLGPHAGEGSRVSASYRVLGPAFTTE